MTDRAHLAFTLALHRAASPAPRATVCWSPFSVASALTLVTQGARGRTRDELARALLGDAAADVGEVAALFARAGDLEPAHGDEDEPVIAVANTLWTDESVRILDSFVDELGRWANGTVRQAPFRSAPDQARGQINSDVAATTRDLIPQLLGPGAITADTVSALVNALYLKCAWRLRFTEGATRPRPFHAPSGTRQVPMMALSERIGYAAVDGWQVAQLSAVGGVEAVVLLPDGDLAEAEAALDADALATLLDAPQLTQVDLALPKLKLTSKAELSDHLRELGVRTVFTRDADLSGISSAQLAVGAVLHEAVLMLDEQGLEGAAATAVMMRMVSMPTRSERLVVDRPFLLVVRQASTGVVYFMARVTEPRIS